MSAAPTTAVVGSHPASTGSTPGQPKGPQTAAQVLSVLESHGLPITGVIVYTAATDPNHMLGRPNGYTSKVAWVDTRINSSQANDTTPGSVDLGGSIEVYPSHSGAEARAKYIAGIAASAPFLNEYDYVAGDTVLRLSSILTPSEAQQYANVLGAFPVTG